MIEIESIKNFCIKYKVDKILYLFCIALWIYITLTNPNIKIFNGNEIWAWNIANDLNFFEIIKLMHYEGHTFLWYSVLKPFTHNIHFYPYIIKFINWFFVLLAMFILGFFSPFNKLIKILIMFSFPFLYIYPIDGRPYGMGIFFIFCLTALYKNKLKYPVLYAVLIFLALNTHLFIAVGAAAFSFLFVNDVWKENFKNKTLALGIILSGFLMLVIQWIPIHIPSYAHGLSYRLFLLKSFFVEDQIYPIYDIYVIGMFINLSSFLLFIIFLKNKHFLLFCGFIFSSLLICFIFIYPAFLQHACFFFVYFIITFWMTYDNSDKRILLPIIILTCLLFSTPARNVNNFDLAYVCKFDTLQDNYKYIQANIPGGSTIYIPHYNDIIQPLLKDYKIKLNNDIDLRSYEAYRLIYMNCCPKTNNITPDDIIVLPNESAYFMTVSDNNESDKIIRTPDNKYMFLKLGAEKK